MRFPRRKPKAAIQALQRISLEGTDSAGRVGLRLVVDAIPEIRHIIEHKPRPRPTVIQPIIRDDEGREYRCNPINCDNRYSVPVYFPQSWLTGRQQDVDKQCSIHLELHYDKPF